MPAKKTILKKSEEEKIEKEYTIPLRKKIRVVPRYKKTNKAVKSIKEFVVRHMKIRDRDLNKVKLDKFLNETLWSRGIKNPPTKIKVKVIKDGDSVIVQAIDLPKSVLFRKKYEEKREKAGEEIIKKKQEQKTAEETAKVGEQKQSKEKQGETEEKQKESKEKKASVIEEGKALEKAKHKEAKHSTKEKAPKSKRPIRQAMEK